MKRSALVVPGFAAALAVVVAVLAGPFGTSVTHAQSSSSLQFEASFPTAADFYDRFDYGYSGPNPYDWGNGSGDGAITSFHGDHNDACEGPTTSRDVSFAGDRDRLDYSQLFWHCAPGGDPAKGHLMTGVDTVSYNIAWFAPKLTFTNVTKVCWDVNLTEISKRKWTQVMFVSAEDAARYPSNRGSGGLDLGYTSPDFRGGDGGPSTGLVPQGGTLAGFKSIEGSAEWFQDQDTWMTTVNPQPLVQGVTDKAARYTHCLENQPDNVVRLTQAIPDGTTRTVDMVGQIPSDPVRVVFQDDNYNPEKDDLYKPDTLTWHWDNIQVYAEASEVVESVAPPSDQAVAAPAAADEAPAGKGGSATAAVIILTCLALIVAGLVLALLLRPVGLAGRGDRGRAEPPPAEPPQD